MRSSRVLRLGVGFKPRTPPPSRPPRSPSSLNRLSEAKRAKPGKPGVFPPTGKIATLEKNKGRSKLKTRSDLISAMYKNDIDYMKYFILAKGL